MRTRVVKYLMAVALLVGAGCGDAESGGSSTSSGNSGTTVATEGADTCAWKVRADKETLNLAYPGTAATYWAVSYALAPGEHLELKGRFPSARYASFVSYGSRGGAIDVLADGDIEPDTGSINPFLGSSGSTLSASGDEPRNYTMEIRPDSGSDAASNVLLANHAGTEQTATTTTTPAAANRVILGSGGPEAVAGTVLYRVYLPTTRRTRPGEQGFPMSGSSTRPA
jgi:hypothetical protein